MNATAIIILLSLLFNPMLCESQNTFRVTAYCPCESCCGDWSNGTFADGSPVGGKAIAADRSIPFGVRITVPGYGSNVAVKDRGGAITGNRLDVYFPDHQEALNWGVRHKKIYMTIADYFKIMLSAKP